MYRIFKLCCTLLLPTAFAASAQSTTSGSAAKTTATATRLKAMVNLYHYSGAFEPGDSSVLDFAPPRGEWQNGWDEWKYDTKSIFYYDNTTHEYYYFANTRNIISYGGDDNPTNMITQNWNSLAWENTNKYEFTYNATNKLATVLSYDWDATAGDWKPQASYRTTYTYDALDRVTRKLSETWSVSTSAYFNSSRYNYVWYTSGNMLSSTRQIWDPSASSWTVTQTREMYTWDASNNKIKTQFLGCSASVWDTGQRLTHSGFHNHVPELTITEGYISGIWYDMTQEHTTFNSEDLPISSYDEDWNASTTTWETDGFSTGKRWYYETYDPDAPLSTPTISNATCRANIFPVPASKELNIDIEWDEPQAFSIYITDMSGRTVSAWQAPTGKRYKEVMPINMLATGNYTMRIKGTKDEIVRRFAVER